MTREARCYTAATESGEDPSQLLGKFLWLGLLCVVALVTLATYGVYRVYSWRLVESAHAEAQAICQIVLVKEKKDLLKIDDGGNVRLFLPESKQANFNRRMQEYLKPYALDAVLIWDRQQRLVNSFGTEQGDRGREESSILDKALAGQSFSRLENTRPGYASDLMHRGALEQMVSYLPIWGRNKTVLGAIEIRRNMESIRAQLYGSVAFSGMLLAAVLSALFFCIYLLVKQGVVRLVKAQEDLRWLATTDPLTGVYNRREVFARTEELFLQRESGDDRNTSFFSVLMIDCDNFKKINDTYGHPAGDHVLREMATRIQSVLRSDDIVGRVGGEEFLVVLPDASLEQCWEIAERLCKAVREDAFRIEGLHISGSISIGGTTAHSLDQNIGELLQRADAGLYRAKALGKDCAFWVERSDGDKTARGYRFFPTP